MDEEPQKQDKKQYDWLKQYQFQKGQSGNPGGRPKGKSLKTFAREILMSMPEEDKADFMRTLDSKTIWEMAEGKAKQDIEHTGTLTIASVLDQLENGSKTPQQGMEN